MKEYKLIPLNGSDANSNSEAVNKAAKEGFEFLEVIQGYRQSDSSYRFPSILMVREVNPCA